MKSFFSSAVSNRTHIFLWSNPALSGLMSRDETEATNSAGTRTSAVRTITTETPIV